jgi:transglutaminase-like putative cysteine protease
VQESAAEAFPSSGIYRTIVVSLFDILIVTRMANPASNSATIPLSKTIDYYFELSLYLLVLTGFATLAGSGGLDIPSMLLTAAAFAVRGYLLATRRQVTVAERWATPLTIGYFVYFGADYFVFSRSFLTATVHLALFAVVVRMFTIRRERDHIMLAVLAFLMVLAAAVLTVDSLFLFSFAAFLVMAITTFVLMEMRRSAQSANVHARQSGDRQERRRLAFSLSRVAPALMVIILAIAAVLFFLIPRRQGGYLGGYSYGTDFASGFSDHVQLGQIGQIQQSNAVVMHIQIDGDTTGRHELHWRGVALPFFDGHAWSKPREQFVLSRFDNRFMAPELEKQTLEQMSKFRVPPQPIHYRVLMEPIGTNVFFIAPRIRSISGGYRMLASDYGGAVYDYDTEHPINRYEADSDIATATPAQLRTAESTAPPKLGAAYLQLRAVDPRVPRLAQEITRSASNNYDKAVAIEHYLQTRYGYTLNLPSTVPEDPIANFLFERKQGHCEYFASAMAVMLRTLGIPSRVVTGFRSDEFNDLTGNYVVRAKDAHAWVEAYFPGFGWETFDPTPAGAGGTPQGWARVGLYIDAMSSFWAEWIINYDSLHQGTLGQTAVSGTRSFWENSRHWAGRHYHALLNWANRTQARVELAPGRWIIPGIAVVAVLALLGNLGRILHWLHQLQLTAHPERSPEQAASMWYGRMASTLKRCGIEKSTAQTPREFVEKIPDNRLRQPVAHFTEVYESARFGNSAEDARRLPELYEEVELASKG